jgi:mono/diheme cytochrome c family protein
VCVILRALPIQWSLWPNPDGKGKAEFLPICTACHSTDTVTHLRKTPDEWRKTVDDMVARGADGSKEDLDNVVLYLSTNFGPEKSGSGAATQSTTYSSISGGPAVMNGSGEVATHSKPGLHLFTIINANPMPSYEGKIMGENLDDLARYLTSLPSAEESLQK